jgi:hypothetical protein
MPSPDTLEISKIYRENLPSLANVDNIDSIRASLEQVWLHVNLQVLGSKMALSAQEHLNILGGGIEDRRKI